MNANAAIGVGNVTAAMSGISSDPVNFPISFTDPPQRNMGPVGPAITVDFNHSTATPNPVTLFQTCMFPNDAVNDFFIQVSNAVNGALTTLAQETTLSPNLAPTNGTQITIAILNVPAGLTLAFTGTQLSSGLAVSPASATTVDQTVDGQPITFVFDVTTAGFRLTFNFSLKPTTVSVTTPLPIANVGTPVNVQGVVQIGPITTTDSIIVRFAPNQIGPTTLATITDVCPPPRVQSNQIISE